MANLGWFVSDRNQPEDKVCVYVFVPNIEKKRVDVNAIGYTKALALANISSIADTQTDEELLRKARQQMVMLRYGKSNTSEKNEEFFFVIDDMHDYRTLSDFRSNRARDLFQEWQARVQQHRRDIDKLDSYRLEYANASAGMRARMKDKIQQLEWKLEDDVEELNTLEYKIRCLEQAELYDE